MSFDFYHEYKTYSNIDLLKIVKRPKDYQTEALSAARAILIERDVTREEIHEVEEYYKNMEFPAKVKKEKIEAINSQVKDFFEPVLQPSEKVDTAKWINLLLLAIAIEYIFIVMSAWKQLKWYGRFDVDIEYLMLTLVIFPLVYIPIEFYLILKRKQWGWIMLFGENMFALITRIVLSITYVHYQNLRGGFDTSFFLPVVIRAIFLIFLWRQSVCDHFTISNRIRNRTAIISAAVIVFFIIFSDLLYG